MVISKEESDRLREVRGAEFFERYSKPHPYAHNLLQGHLFIEEQLEVIVMSVFLEPDAVIEAKLSFWTKLKLAQGVTGKSAPYWLAIDKLNSARNELAHGRDMAVLERKIDDFLSAVPSSGRQRHQKIDSREQKLKLAIVRVAAYAARMAEDFRPQKPAASE